MKKIFTKKDLRDFGEIMFRQGRFVSNIGKRQGLNVSVYELNNLIKELKKENNNIKQKFIIPIINKDGYSDTWHLE